MESRCQRYALRLAGKLMDNIQEIERRDFVGRRHGIRFDRGRLPASGGGALAPPTTPGVIIVDSTTGVIQVDLTTGIIQVEL
jgi:hypothetical protein